MSGTSRVQAASDHTGPLVRNNPNWTNPAPIATRAPNRSRPARESGVVRGSEIMLNANWSSSPLCGRWSGMRIGSPSHSERPNRIAA